MASFLETIPKVQWQEDQVILNFLPDLWTDEQFLAFCRANPELRIERTAQGRLIIMPPAGTETGGRNADFTTDLTIWNRKTKLGKVFDSSAGFTLPDGAERSPDVSWIERSRWEALTTAERERFAPLCPDFVAELRSKTDRLSELQEKMREYIANGARLGWLLDPKNRAVEIYRPNQPVEVLQDPSSLSGEDVLPGFVLDLMEIFA